MGVPRKGFMVRLPRGTIEQKFTELCRHFRGLPPSTLLRMLLSDTLSRPKEEQIEAINRQITGVEPDEPKAKPAPPTASSRNTNRIRSTSK